MLLAGLKISTDPTAWQFSARQIVPMKKIICCKDLPAGVLGTNNIDNGSSLYYAAARQAFYDSVGFPGITYTLNDLTGTDLILVVGAEPAASAPLINYEIKRAVKLHGAKLILIDPRKTKLTLFADCWLRPEVDTDLMLLNSLAKVIIDEI